MICLTVENRGKDNTSQKGSGRGERFIALKATLGVECGCSGFHHSALLDAWQMKNAAKVVGIICIAGSFASFFFAISFYYRDIPSRPQPGLGRVYPINNHGFPLYLTKKEDFEQTLASILAVVLFATVGILDYFFDAFDNRTREILRKRREPWNHRWGP